MARLWSSGFEFNSSTAAVEFSTISGSPTFQTSTVRSGNYAMETTGLSSATPKGIVQQFISAAGAGPFFARTYFRYHVLPTADNTILSFDASGTSITGIDCASLKVSSTGTLKLFNATVQVGSASAALSADTWYRIELRFDSSGGAGLSTLEGVVEGAVFATASNLTITQATTAGLKVGANLHQEAQTTGDFFFDDIAINDGTGAAQTSYPGIGSVIALRPATTGDANSFATQTGGTAGSSFNYTRVNEVTPDDATTLNGSNTINQEDLFRLEKIQAAGAINLVQVFVRFRNNVVDATTALKLEIKKESGGTTTQSSAIIPNTTTWNTNTTAVPHNPVLTLYQDPDSVNWNQNSINNMQIGYKITAGSTNRVEVSNIIALVETVDIAKYLKPLTINNYQFIRAGDGMSVGEKVR